MSQEIFRYHQLAAEVRSPIESHAAAIKQMLAQADQLLQRAVGIWAEAGRRLIDAKMMLPHGQFGPWLATEFRFSDRYARALMRIGERWGKTETASDLTFRALDALCGDDVPESARDEAKDRAADGERITGPIAAEIIERHQDAEEMEEPAEHHAPGVTGPRPTSARAPAPPQDNRMKRLHAARIHLERAHRELDGLGGEGEGPLGHVELAQSAVEDLLGG